MGTAWTQEVEKLREENAALKHHIANLEMIAIRQGFKIKAMDAQANRDMEELCKLRKPS